MRDAIRSRISIEGATLNAPSRDDDPLWKTVVRLPGDIVVGLISLVLAPLDQLGRSIAQGPGESGREVLKIILNLIALLVVVGGVVGLLILGWRTLL